MISKILKQIEGIPVTITAWGVSFICIVFVRLFFESLSSPTSSGVIASDPYTIIHYGLFFLCVTLGSSLVVGFYTTKYKEAIKIILFGLPLLWLAPLVDIVLSHGRGYKMLYVFDTGKSLLFDLVTFLGPNLDYGATYGMRIGIGLALIGLGYYIWLRSESLLRAVAGGFSLYILVFIIGSLPGVLYTISHISNPESTAPTVVNFLETNILHSTIVYNTLREGIYSVSQTRFLELVFNKFLSQILFILSCLFGLILFYKIDYKKLWSILQNARPERLGFYTVSLFCGMGFAYINDLGNRFVWIDLFGVACLIISWAGLWMYAVHTNDIVDVDIDKISNTERPLIKKEVSKNDMWETGNVWLVVGLLGSWCAGFYPFFMSLVYLALSFIYSAPPLRLRRFPVIPSFLISVACLSTILAGFFFISVNKNVQAFPIFLAVGIIIMVTLAINFKDIKDIDGDKANGIVTLPILFGDNGIKVVGACFALSILLVPFFLSFYLLYIISIPAAIVGYRLITKRPYREKPIFLLRFIFLAGIALFYLAVYLLAHTYNLI